MTDLWIPFAKRFAKPLFTHGPRPLGWPEGLIVHCTAGRGDAAAALNWQLVNGYAYLVIEKSGQLWQGHPLDQWGSHAGKAYHPEWGKQVSMHTLGVECICAGALIRQTDGRFKSCFGSIIPPENVREFRPPGDPRKDREAQTGGYYEKLTEPQETTLAELAWWLQANSPPGVFALDNVLGHDVVEDPPGRKSDPGGSLSRSIPDFQACLKASYDEVKAKFK